MIFSREQWFSFQHLCKYAPSTPNINLDVVLLPREHDFGSSVISRRNIAGHLGVLDTSETEIADFEIAVLVDQDIAVFEITMNDTGGVNILQSSLRSVRI